MAGLLAAYTIVLLRTAWLCDDAFITFRVVDNALRGYGLTWNTFERVQAYTDPLWMFLLAGLRGLGIDLVWAGWFLSIAVSLAAVIVLSLRLADSTGSAVLSLVALMLSRAFVDFSTSGQENSLTHLLLALFLVFLARGGVLLPGVVAGLLFLNRADTVLLVAPAMGLRLVETARDFRLGRAFRGLAGAALALAWEVFSLVYYGFPLPNTAYAKLGGGLTAHGLAAQGLRYIGVAARRDPITLAVIALGLLYPLVTRRGKDLALGLGTLLYVLYVIRVGGDFMEGRFLSAPFFLAVALVAGSMRRGVSRAPVTLGVASLSALAFGLLTPCSPVLSGSRFGEGAEAAWSDHGIVDERAYYFQHMGLLRANRRIGPGSHPWAAFGRYAQEAHLRVVRQFAVGMLGFFAGPGVDVLDYGGLGDPLLPRLPVRVDRISRIGHFERVIPAGYEESLRSGENRLDDPKLREFYGHLIVITRGPLFTRKRLWTIWRFNRGEYDTLIDTKKYSRALPLPEPRPWTELSGGLDGPAENQVVTGTLVVRGWARVPGEDLDVTVLIDGKGRKPAYSARYHRGDVELILPELGDCSRAGFEARFEPSAADVGEHSIVVVFRSRDGRSREYPVSHFTWRR